jgi:hypothetical protein
MAGITRPSIVIVCGDPGGASAVGKVIKLLELDRRVFIKPVAYKEAATVWDEMEIPYQKIPDDFTQESTLALLKKPDVKLLFTGTSVNSVDLEKQFIVGARQIGLPSLSLVDFWTNYTWRFSDNAGNLVYLPDKIAVMDEYACQEMIREGFDPSGLVNTGQPVFDDLADWRAQFSIQRRDEIRTQLGVRAGELLVLFASQPLTSLYGTDTFQTKYLGFDEWSVLEDLIKSLEDIKAETDANIHLVIRPHPRETVGPFMDYRSDSYPITVVETGSGRSQVMAADLVVGMNTELLIEACYLGCITLSLQPGLRHPDRLPTNRLGFSRAVYNQEDIKPALRELLLDEAARSRMLENVSKFKLKSKSAWKVASLIYKMIDLPQESEGPR